MVASAFSAPSTTSIVAPAVFIRNTGGGNLVAGVYTVRLTVRYICTVGAKKYWSCRAYTVAITYDPGTGANGTVGTPVNTMTGPPDNSASCDSPAP